MTRYLVFVICVLGAALAPLAAVAQNTSSHTITISPASYDWQQIVGHFDALADTIGTTSVEGATTEPFDPAALHDFRIVCAEPLVAWARELILADCTDLADCVSRKASMERIARGLAEEVSVRLDDDAPDADVFLRPGMELKSSLTDRAEALSLRSAHDQWLSAWSIPKKLMANENAVARDEARIMDRVWCDMVRENAKAAISHVEEFGFPSDVPDSGQGHLVTAGQYRYSCRLEPTAHRSTACSIRRNIRSRPFKRLSCGLYGRYRHHGKPVRPTDRLSLGL